MRLRTAGQVAAPGAAVDRSGASLGRGEGGRRGRSGALCGRRGVRSAGSPGAADVELKRLLRCCLTAFQVEFRTEAGQEVPGTSTPSMLRAGGASAGVAGSREGDRGPLEASGWGR